MPQLEWSLSMRGELPGVLLRDEGILLHFTVGGQQPITEIAYFDVQGHRLWSRPDRRGVLSLPDERFLVMTPVGEPLVIDRRGETVCRWQAEGVTKVARHGDALLLAGAGHVWASDLELERLWEVAWPGQDPVISCFADGAFYWAEENEVKFCGRDGRSGTFARLDDALVADTMDRYEQAMGGATIFHRDWPLIWQVTLDEKRGLFFLTSHVLHHLALCLDRSGRSLWCECLGPGCCGGKPYALPNDLYVTAGGCNGILSWFDAEGNVLIQSWPPRMTGNQLSLLPDGRILADGGPGLVCYGATGELHWEHESGYLEFQCDPVRDVLVGCSHSRADANGPSMAHLELLSGL